mgnify:CR=1 FL=1
MTQSTMTQSTMTQPTMKPITTHNGVFNQVNYRQFRQHLAHVTKTLVKCKGFETIIYDHHRDIQSIVYAASIDDKGRCYPAKYFVRPNTLAFDWPQVA